MRLHETEREVLAAEAAHYAARSPQRDDYRRLAEAAQAGEVPEELADLAAQLLELGLSTGRIRAVYGPHGEMTARATFRRTPRGRQLASQAAEATRALAALAGRRLERVSLSAPGPGSYLVTLQTEGATITVSLDRAGPVVRSLEVSL